MCAEPDRGVQQRSQRQRKLELRRQSPAPTKTSYFTIKWDAGTIGSGPGHIRIASAGAADTSMGVALTTPLLDATGCSKVSFSFRHVLTGIGAGLQPEFGIVDDTGKITAWEETDLYTFLNTDTAQPTVGNFVVLAALPANKKFRLRWGATHRTPTASVLWAIDDVVVQGAP